MTASKTQPFQMLADVIREAAAGKKVTLKTRFLSEVVPVEKDGKRVDTNVLSVEYSGRVDGTPFTIIKNYLFSEDAVRHPLECLVIANNRLQMDYARLKKAGIPVKEEFFTFENAQIKGTPPGPIQRTSYRLQDFILLSRAGVPVTFSLTLKYPELVLKQGEGERKGFACMGEFEFQTAEGTTRVEKLYAIGSYDEPKGYQNEVKAVATKRLERDLDRLRRAGIKVGKTRF
jgi:hypothetical protein